MPAFDITRDSFITKATFIKKAGVSRNTLDKYLESDPNAPKPHNTPIGDRMFLTSEVNAWLTSLDPNLRVVSINGIATDAAKAIAE